MTVNAFGEPLTPFKCSTPAVEPVDIPAPAAPQASPKRTRPLLRPGVSRRVTLNLRAPDEASMDFLVAVLRGAFEVAA